MGSLSIIHILLLLIILGIPLILMLILRFRLRKEGARYRSLKLTSPVLIALILMFSALRPLLQKENSAPIFLPANVWDLVILAALISLAGATIWTAIFYFKALANLNYFNKQHVASPELSLLAFIPLINIIGGPYMQYVAYFGTMNFAQLPASRASALFLTFGGMVLTLLGIVSHIGSEALIGADQTFTSIWVASTCAGLIGGVLLSRVVNRIATVQEALAAGIAAETIASEIFRSRQIYLQNAALIGLTLLAGAALLFPSGVTEAANRIRTAF
jgi:hypothetical protein